jgi:uncharacterized membrane-anchored protein
MMLVWSTLSFADENVTPPEGATDAASTSMVVGPSDISINGMATLKLPEKFGFIPKDEAIKILEEMGNGSDYEVEGLIMSLEEGEANKGFVVVSYVESGYIKDDDAKDWNADDLISSIKEGTEAMNKERVARGYPEIEVIGWIAPPSYDATTHQLVWSAESADKGEAGTTHGVNYNTYVLGREGYISLNLVTDTDNIDALKPTAQLLLDSMSFDSGKSYADFDAGTDKVAEYGLAALVAGVAAKKLGFFALIAAFAIKFAKLIGVALVGGWYLLRGFFGKKEAE